MKNKIKQMRSLKLKLDADNWQDKKLLARWHKLGAKVSMELAVNLTLFADLGMVTVCAWQGNLQGNVERFVEFEADTATPNGAGLQINAKLEVTAVSHPKPRGIKLPGLDVAPTAD